MHNRSIRKNKFNLPAMRKLWTVMGEYDALVEYNECAIRHFITKWESCKECGKDNLEFLREQSAEVGIHLGGMNIERFKRDLYRWYLIYPYACIDTFIREFKSDLSFLGFNINTDFPNKSSLEKLIAGLKTAGIKVSVEKYKLDVDRYYHRCRNLLAHRLEDNVEQRKLFDGIDRQKVYGFYPTLTGALQTYGELNFDDFTLCTANLKNITDTLTTDVFDAIDWSLIKFSGTQVKTKCNKYIQNPERAKKYIKNHIASIYGITVSDETVEILLQNLAQSNNG